MYAKNESRERACISYSVWYFFFSFSLLQSDLNLPKSHGWAFILSFCLPSLPHFLFPLYPPKLYHVSLKHHSHGFSFPSISFLFGDGGDWAWFFSPFSSVDPQEGGAIRTT